VISGVTMGEEFGWKQGIEHGWGDATFNIE
jgi:hypothetical protein